MTETAALADMVLPLATSFESWDLMRNESLQGDAYLSLQQPVVQRQAETVFLKAGGQIASPPFRPLGQAVAFGDICIELAQRIGGDVAGLFPFRSSREYIEQLVERFDDLRRAGGFEHLQEHGFWNGGQMRRGRDRGYVAGGFNTPSGKYEIFSESLEKMGYDPLPSWAEVPQGETAASRFRLVTFRPHFHTERTANCKWLVELSHEYPVWINTGRARQLGIEEGDMVRLSSSVGEVTTRVHVTDCIHEEAVAMARGYGHWEWGPFARAVKEESADPDTQLIWWMKTGNGVHPGRLIPFHTDPAGGGQVWQGIEVEMSKIS
jgi:thiosulfate reductase/polysulfide reductase chain A